MTRFVDQDPQNQHGSTRANTSTETAQANHPAQETQAFPSTPLHEAAGQHFPTDSAHPDFPDPRHPGIIPPYVTENPDNAAAREIIPTNPQRSRRNLLMVGGAAAMAILVPLGAYFGAKAGDSDPKSELDKATPPSTSAPLLPGQTNPEQIVNASELSIDEATSDQFYDNKNFTQQDRVRWATEYINSPTDDTNPEYAGMSRLDATWHELAKRYNKPGEYQYLKELVELSESMTGNQISARFSVLSEIVSKAPSLDLQYKLLASFTDPENPKFESLKSRLANGENLTGTSEVPVNSETNQSMESPTFRFKVLENGYDPDGISSKLMTVVRTSVNPPLYSQNIVKFTDGIPVLVDVYDTDSPKMITYPQYIHD